MNPHALYELLLRVHREYAPRLLYVTENGAAFGDVRDHHGRVRDPERIDYLAGYLDAVGRAIAAGVPVRGYFIWSLLDNFEWSLGYGRRFGLVYVDYPTLERVPKESFHWYRGLIGSSRAASDAGGLAGRRRCTGRGVSCQDGRSRASGSSSDTAFPRPASTAHGRIPRSSSIR